jgi:lipopolysaccharide heptosyltransferase II
MLPDVWSNVRRILAIRLDNVGDVVMLGPALRTLRHALPSASLTLMASPAGSQVAPLLPWVDDVMVERVVWQDASGAMPLDPEREQTLVQRIRSHDFDAAVIFTSFSQSPHPPAYICYLAGIPIRLGQSKEFGGSLLTQWVKPLPDSAHQVDRNLHLLEAASFTILDRHLALQVPNEVQWSADQLLRRKGVEPDAPFIVLAAGASCAARRYDPERFAEVARLLSAQTALPIVVVGSAREAELVQPILGAGGTSLVGQTSVAELVAVIRRAGVVIANNSGPLHIAEAFQRPMVILYSGTEYESQWQPRVAPARLLRRPTECSPCYRFQCPYQMECLDIPPEEVVAEVLAMLERSPGMELVDMLVDKQERSPKI